MSCNHQFIGDAEGVTCELCGIRMTAEEYRSFLSGEFPRKEEPQETEAPKKRTRKVKEV